MKHLESEREPKASDSVDCVYSDSGLMMGCLIEPPLSPEPKPTYMLDVYHPSAMGSKVMVRTLPDIKNVQLNLRDSPHPEISQTVFDAMAENKKARLVQVNIAIRGMACY